MTTQTQQNDRCKPSCPCVNCKCGTDCRRGK